MDIIITGSSGFLGSHLLSMWLQQNTSGRAACIVRGTDVVSARQKLTKALQIALQAQNALSVLPELQKRITVIPGDIESADWVNSPIFQTWLTSASCIEVFHGAASISFRKDERDMIWKSNVEGLKTLLNCLSGIANIQTFNHISTAYVAGNRESWVYEDDGIIPGEFNNHYEESKWTAEGLVHQLCPKMGMAYRIFRPSIIIGNSNTFKTSADIGFYKVVDTLMQLATHSGIGSQPLQVPFALNASLDLIPVDITVNEMLAIVKFGRASHSRTYHITNECPLTVADIFFGISPLLGIEFCTEPANTDSSSLLLSLVKRSIRHYLPYFNNVRRFDRRNVHAFGAHALQDNFRLDIVKLRKFVKTYMEDKISASDTVDLGPAKLMQG